MAATPARELVCVFGASWAQPESALYAEGVALGAALAASGFDVITGGYGGLMEATSKGCAEGGGGATGVLVPSLFPQRASEGNPYLTARVDAPSLLTRIDAMLVRAPRLLVALPGTLGTLTELMAAWNVALLAPIGGYEAATIVAWRKPWERIIDTCGAELALTAEQRALVRFVDGVDECVAALKERVGK
jgi:uncharacterized protein (TIGR00725 family)